MFGLRFGLGLGDVLLRVGRRQFGWLCDRALARSEPRCFTPPAASSNISMKPESRGLCCAISCGWRGAWPPLVPSPRSGPGRGRQCGCRCAVGSPNRSPKHKPIARRFRQHRLDHWEWRRCWYWGPGATVPGRPGPVRQPDRPGRSCHRCRLPLLVTPRGWRCFGTTRRSLRHRHRRADAG
jgi:hypothetical protein